MRQFQEEKGKDRKRGG